MDNLFAEELNKINRRAGHVGVCYKNQLYVWGGYTQMPPEGQHNPYGQFTRSTYYKNSKIWIYNCLRERWYLHIAAAKYGEESIPPDGSGACAVLENSYVYVFGGYSIPYQNSLYRLDLKTLTWEKLSPSGVEPLRCDKLSGWSYNGKVYFFGGFGEETRRPFPIQFQWVRDTATVYPIGWNNQLVCYDPATDCWEWPKTTGCAPLPRAAHSCATNGKFAYVFGGRLLHSRRNDLHILDLESMSWSGEITESDDNKLWPQGRSWHSLSFIRDNVAVLYGGFTQHNEVLKDCWLLDVRERPRWISWDSKGCDKVLWHTALSNNGELYVVGGIKKDPNIDKLEHPDEMLVINFSPRSLYRLCLDAVVEYDSILLIHHVCLPPSIASVLKERIRWKKVKQMQVANSMPHAPLGDAS